MSLAAVDHDGPMRNWAGNQTYHARRLLEPTSVEELQELVRGSRRIRALGTCHAFNDLADTDGDLVSVARLPRRFELDRERSTVTVHAAVRYGDLGGPLAAAGFALHNLASLPHLTVAGAIATATHGSGNRLGSLSTAVVALELVGPDGALVRIPPRSAAVPLDGAVVALGALGVVTAVTLRVEPAVPWRQDVFEDLPFATVVERFDDVTSAAPVVSLFTDWAAPRFHQVWLKGPADRVAAGPLEPPAALARTRPAPADRHPIPGLPPDACTPQRGVPGPWHERMPHFRLDHVPSAGAELQTELFVARADAGRALAALLPLGPRLAPLVWVTEVRTVAADRHWLSPAFERDVAGIHFTWKPDWPAVREAIGEVQARLAPFAPRPHWAKLFTLEPAEIRERLPGRERFAVLAAELDPEGVFRNDFVERYVL
jgi:xylitol oxidase